MRESARALRRADTLLQGRCKCSEEQGGGSESGARWGHEERERELAASCSVDASYSVVMVGRGGEQSKECLQRAGNGVGVGVSGAQERATMERL
ncbi:hypothetical protein GOP47_0022578 [Adiantum capillus-veneris]|uniref:Uncharacterized protein n=1 Tax=Adiantum capillus-veneris TaxID=13818 RepID=A0A9D4U7M0_ADICA|nr:hypothetical protein GOP47_0022578 [Adiantum capillus-veneris]